MGYEVRRFDMRCQKVLRGSEKSCCLWLTYDPICSESLDFSRLAEVIEEAAKEGKF